MGEAHSIPNKIEWLRHLIPRGNRGFAPLLPSVLVGLSAPWSPKGSWGYFVAPEPPVALKGREALWAFGPLGLRPILFKIRAFGPPASFQEGLVAFGHI